jgi:hypothetical protein
MTSATARFLASISSYRNGVGPRQLCLACVDVLPVDGAAIALAVAPARWEALSASDTGTARTEAQQALAGEGPAFDAVRTGSAVAVSNLATMSDRWPGFAAALDPNVSGAMFAFPMTLGATAVGALDLYRGTPGPASTDEVDAMQSVTDAVTTVLLSTEAPAGLEIASLTSWWTPASVEVHQATGMVVAQLGVPPDIAFLRLRAHAFSTERTLADVARDVVSRRLRFKRDDNT